MAGQRRKSQRVSCTGYASRCWKGLTQSVPVCDAPCTWAPCSGGSWGGQWRSLPRPGALAGHTHAWRFIPHVTRCRQLRGARVQAASNLPGSEQKAGWLLDLGARAWRDALVPRPGFASWGCRAQLGCGRALGAGGAPHARWAGRAPQALASASVRRQRGMEETRSRHRSGAGLKGFQTPWAGRAAPPPLDTGS